MGPGRGRDPFGRQYHGVWPKCRRHQWRTAECLEAAPGGQQSQAASRDLTGLSGEQITGDLLTATTWSWFAAAESHSRLSQNQASVVETLGLSYGLFRAQAEPVYSWGLIRKVEFPGVNIDIGHVCLLGWSKNAQAIEWAQYMRLRGQYKSEREHAVPERLIFQRLGEVQATPACHP